jgi:hypothetical protein
MENEIWKQIPFEQNYEVSTKGRVRNKETGHIKSHRLARTGYPRVTLYPSGKTYQIHRLVMLTFQPHLVNECVNHIDGNPANNNIENLEWCTLSHNMRHYSTKLVSKWVGQMNPSTNLDLETAKSIKIHLKVFTAREVADMFSLRYEMVRRIKTGQHWNHVKV